MRKDTGININELASLPQKYNTIDEQIGSVKADLNRKINGLERRTKGHFSRVDDCIEDLINKADDLAAECRDLDGSISESFNTVYTDMSDMEEGIRNNLDLLTTDISNLQTQHKSDTNKLTIAIIFEAVIIIAQYIMMIGGIV